MKTNLSIKGNDFYINGVKTYSESAKKEVHGLLMNARFIQGVFDDSTGRERYNRYGKEFDPEVNTDELIAALPQWYDYGLRGFTVGLQGGGPCFTLDNKTILNQPYSNNGKTIDPAYLDRLDRLIQGADAIGMVVIVSLFYPGQAGQFTNGPERAMGFSSGEEIENSIKSACDFFMEKAYTNIIIEICNEHDLVYKNPLMQTDQGMASLIRMTQAYTDNAFPVGCSGMGGSINEEVCRASDVVLFHGNGLSRGHYYNMIKKIQKIAPDKPLVCNEDSQAIGNMVVGIKEHTSWGYYNNMTKQEPPVYWEITRGEDEYFARRMAIELGLKTEEEMVEASVSTTYLQGLEPHMTYEDKRWIRLASLYPEKIDYVEFYHNDKLFTKAYDEPFMVNYECNWKQSHVVGMDPEGWRVSIVNKK